MKKSIDINCDLGEGMGIEAEVMPYISSANIACGYHAGDPVTIRTTIEQCLAHHVAIGAHPSFDDRAHFGRIDMYIPDEQLIRIVGEQILLMMDAAKKAGADVHHVKPHGALYNMAARDPHMAAVICGVIRQINPSLVLYGLSGSQMILEGKKAGLQVMQEAFADRMYRDDGSLAPRNRTGALISEMEMAITQSMQMIEHGRVTTISGKVIHLELDTLCIHGDGPHAVAMAKALYKVLTNTGITVGHPVRS